MQPKISSAEIGSHEIDLPVTGLKIDPKSKQKVNQRSKSTAMRSQRQFKALNKS